MFVSRNLIIPRWTRFTRSIDDAEYSKSNLKGFSYKLK